MPWPADPGRCADEAFQLLASRSDRQSEELSLQYTLQTLKSGPPTPAMYSLLNRTKDPRAVPLLLAAWTARLVTA